MILVFVEGMPSQILGQYLISYEIPLFKTSFSFVVYGGLVCFTPDQGWIHASAVADLEQHGAGQQPFHKRMAEAWLQQLPFRRPSDHHLDPGNLF